MAYGVVSSSVLLSFGVPPAAASASVHAAELFTTAASAGSHVWHRNVNWKLFRTLAPVGILGGVVGTYVLTAVDDAVLRPFVAGYLGLMGVYILYRAYRAVHPIDSPIARQSWLRWGLSVALPTRWAAAVGGPS